MEIHQDSVLCTLGYVDPATRTAFTAGHCRASGTVTDKTGTVIGTQGSYRDNTPDGMTVDTNHQIADWEVIHLLPSAKVNNVLPSGKVLVTDPAVLPVAGMPVCHFGVVTGRAAAPWRPSTTAGSRWPTVWSAVRVTPAGRYTPRRPTAAPS